MQIPYVKYLKTKNQDTLLVYFERNTLFFKIGTQSGWSHPQIIADQVNPSFALNQYQQEIFVLYSTRLGELYIIRTKDFIKWDRKQISIEKRDLSQTKFFMIPDQNALHLFYHIPTETVNVHALVYTVFRNGKWEKPCQIDRFLPFGQTPFFTGKRHQKHILLYYRTVRNIITVREMLLSPSTIGSMYPVIQTPYPCSDLSIIQDRERIHLLYIIKGLFRSQVIYQYKQSASISAPRILWESSSCEQCLIFQQNNKLQAIWISNGQPYCCQSINNGNSFSPIEQYTARFPYHCIKGEFLPEENATLNASEAFGDAQNGFQLAVFHSAASTITLLTNDIIAASRTSPENISDFTSEQHSKSQQIEELTKLLVHRGEEIAKLNMRWREKHNQTETEKQNLTLQVASLELENQALKQRIIDLEALQLQTETQQQQSEITAQQQNIAISEQQNTEQKEALFPKQQDSSFMEQDISQQQDSSFMEQDISQQQDSSFMEQDISQQQDSSFMEQDISQQQDSSFMEQDISQQSSSPFPQNKQQTS